MNHEFCFVNGKFINTKEATISLDDRAFLFGAGIYESIAVENGLTFLLENHLDRLDLNLSLVGIKNPYSKKEWIRIVNDLISKNHILKAKCYIQVTDGTNINRSHGNFGTPNTHVKLYPWNETKLSNKAITVVDQRWGMCHIKSTSLLANVIAAKNAAKQGCCEAIFKSNDGHIYEGTSSNVFIVSKEQIITPPTSNKLLNGVTRQVVLQIAQENGLNYKEDQINIQDLYSADECFTTSSYKKIHPITSIDNHTIGNGQYGRITKMIDQLYNTFKRSVQSCLIAS